MGDGAARCRFKVDSMVGTLKIKRKYLWLIVKKY